MNRRNFLHTSALLITLSFVDVSAKEYAKKIIIFKEPYQSLHFLQLDLFGFMNENSINFVGFMNAVFDDKMINLEDREFLLNGVKWLNESSNEIFSKGYISLTPSQRQSVLKSVATYRWGDGFIFEIMKYYFEAMFSDPVYGSNIDQAGWKFLDHSSGLPRPKRVQI